MTINEYFGDWLKVLDVNELNRLLTFLTSLYKVRPIVPAFANVFRAFTLCSEADCRAVFLGQDPYPQKGVATGILFGNNKNTKELSPSLQVVMDSVQSLPQDSMSFQLSDITMESWARQGILMINSALTCEMNRIGSHVMLWRPFLSKLLTNLSSDKEDIVYVLFGNQAQSFAPYIKRGFILKERHPAYYARMGSSMSNKVFVEVNSLIRGTPIKWCTD